MGVYHFSRNDLEGRERLVILLVVIEWIVSGTWTWEVEYIYMELPAVDRR